MPFAFAAMAAATLAGGAMSADASKSAANTQAGAANRSSELQMAMLNRTQGNLAPWLNSGTMSLAQLSRLAGLPGYSADAASNKVNFKGQEFDSMDALHQALYDDYAKQVGNEPIRDELTGAVVGSRPRTSEISEDAIRKAMSVATPVANSAPSQDPMFGMLNKPFGLDDFQASPAYQFNLQQGQQAIDKAAAARGQFYAPATLQSIAKYSQGLASNEFQNAYGNYNTNLGNIWNRLYSLSGAGQNAAANMGGFGTTVAGNVGNNAVGAGNALAAGQVGAANAYSGIGSNLYNQYVQNQILQNSQRSSVPSYDPNFAQDASRSLYETG
jgi:hypothetical protein